MKKLNPPMLGLIKSGKIAKNETPSFCNQCGQCCKGVPGGYAPDQFNSRRQIKKALLSGRAILDYWCAKDGANIYYLRPKKEGERSLIAPSFYNNGMCVNLTLVGCALDWKDRPHGCRTLNATAPKTCESLYEGEPIKQRLAHTWHKSRFRLWEIAKEMGL